MKQQKQVLPELGFHVGEIVHDDLTRELVKVIGISCAIGVQGTDKGVTKYPDEFWVIGYWVDSDWVGCGRYPWELSKLLKKAKKRK